MDEQGLLATYFPRNRIRRIRIGVIAALACVAIVAVITRGLASPQEPDVSLKNVQLFGGFSDAVKSIVSSVVTPQKVGAAPKTCDTCCPPVPNPLIMPPASCGDVAVDLASISNTLATLAKLIQSQHLADLCKVSGSIKAQTGVDRNSVLPNRDIAQKASELQGIVNSLLQQSKARIAFDASAQSAAAISAKVEAEKAKVDNLKKQQEAAEQKLRDSMAALAKAEAEQKIKDAKAKKEQADKAALAQKVRSSFVALANYTHACADER
jgi:hypothetical protein